MSDMAELDMGFAYDRDYENDLCRVVDVECDLCHWDEEVQLARGESADGGIECPVCDRGSMFPVNSRPGDEK